MPSENLNSVRVARESGSGYKTAYTPSSQFHIVAIQGLIPFGRHAGLRTRLRDGDSPRRNAVKKKLCADHRGFTALTSKIR